MMMQCSKILCDQEKERKPNLCNWKYKKGAATAHFQDDADEFWVHSTQWAVPCHAGHPHVINAVLGSPCLAKDMPELALPDEGHV